MNIRTNHQRGEKNQLNTIDCEILAYLQSDGKIALSELGERVGLSASSVMERIRKLEKSGVIEGYSAKVNARSVGLDVCSFIGVSVQNPDHLQSFEGWIEEQAQVLECHHVTGSYTLLVKIRTRDTQSLEDLIRRIRSQEGVLRTETMVVLSTQTEHFRLPIDELAEKPSD